MSVLRVLAAGFGLLLVLILLPASVIAALLWTAMPNQGGQARIPGLKAPVSITFDQDGIPRIQAASIEDAAAALGYVHARERMFQMDLMRRSASGRLSELAGPVTLNLDRNARLLGLRQRAEADLKELPAQTRAVLDAYAQGVNAWIAARGRFAAPEFIYFGAPEPWSAVDSLLWGKTMGLWLSMNYRTELARLALKGKLPPARIDELWPPDNQSGHPDARAGDTRFAGAAPLAPVAARVLAELPHFPDPFTLPDRASNGWAVDGRHTASGAPLLAGDPHLAYGFPAIWYLARIETPQGVWAGATAPGVPFLVLGHNGHIAWTFTTTGADTQDVFIETVLPGGMYQTPDGPKPFLTRQERIKVRGQPDEVMEVRETRHGPVISDLDRTATDRDRAPVLAVEMANLAPHDTAAAGLTALNLATSVQEAGKAAALISAPVQNLIVADRSTIALYVTGRIPIRRAGDGSAPVEGADGAHDWTGFASGEQLPHYVSPESGRLVNANDRVAPRDFPVFLGRDWFGDWRAIRIHALLDRAGRLTPADFALMQVDDVSTFAQQVLPVLRGVRDHTAEGSAAQAASMMAEWDGTMARDRPEPLIFNAWLQRFYAAVLTHAGIPGRGIAPWEQFVQYVLTPAGAHWCGEDCMPLLAQALNEAATSLAGRYGPDPAKWRWGAAHQAVFAHPLLGRIPVLERLATARIPVPGDATTIFEGGNGPGSLEAMHGPEFRGVYDLAHLDESLFMMAPGQSGNPLSGQAWNFLARWRDGATIRLGPRPDRVAATLRLDP